MSPTARLGRIGRSDPLAVATLPGKPGFPGFKTKGVGKMEYEVVYTVQYLTTIKVEEGQSLEDALHDIDIPEGGGSHYKEKSFKILDVTDDQGKAVDF